MGGGVRRLCVPQQAGTNPPTFLCYRALCEFYIFNSFFQTFVNLTLSYFLLVFLSDSKCYQLLISLLLLKANIFNTRIFNSLSG